VEGSRRTGVTPCRTSWDPNLDTPLTLNAMPVLRQPSPAPLEKASRHVIPNRRRRASLLSGCRRHDLDVNLDGVPAARLPAYAEIMSAPTVMAPRWKRPARRRCSGPRAYAEDLEDLACARGALYHRPIPPGKAVARRPDLAWRRERRPAADRAGPDHPPDQITQAIWPDSIARDSSSCRSTIRACRRTKPGSCWP